MPLQSGTSLGPFEILASIGAGGMGEVYRARDTRLGRDVAIKISAAPFSGRFEREARAIAALCRMAEGSSTRQIGCGLPAVAGAYYYHGLFNSPW